jgi:hypothetical protein
MAVETPTPITREEMYLDAIAEGGGTTDAYTKSETDALLAKKPGEITTGKQYVIDGQTVTAGPGAEVFNTLTGNKASGPFSHAEGAGTPATGPYSHAEGGGAKASGAQSHAEGGGSTASGTNSHAEGSSVASGNNSHAEGTSTTASGANSHSEGSMGTIASGNSSHAEGQNTMASGTSSHAEGQGTKASSVNQHVQGKFNVEDANDTYAFIIGNGTGYNARHNAFAIDWNGLIYVNGAATGVNVSTLPTENDFPSMTQAEYDALTPAQKTALYYFIHEDDTTEEESGS